MPSTSACLSRFFRAAPLLLLVAASTVHCAEGATLVDDVDRPVGPRTGGEADASTGRDASARPNDSGTSPRDAAADDAAVEEEEEDAAVDAAIPPASVCATGTRQVGEYAIWQGKVNIHRATGGTWENDSDCTTGADNNTVAYCKKLWPATTTQVELPQPTSEIKTFTSVNCEDPVPHRGFFQYVCCAPD